MVQTILAKIKAALTGPLAIAIGMLLLVGIGGGVGYVVANMMIKAEEKKKAEWKAAEEEAKRGPPKPQLRNDRRPGHRRECPGAARRAPAEGPQRGNAQEDRCDADRQGFHQALLRSVTFCF